MNTNALTTAATATIIAVLTDIHDNLFCSILLSILWLCWVVLEICDIIEPRPNSRDVMWRQVTGQIDKWNEEHPDNEIELMR